jgi:hypothetical protein
MKYYQLDNDTKKYIKRLSYNGYKTPADIYSIDQFIRGLKDLGVWGNFVDAWFMRNNQNVGTGSSVFSFRNSTYNANLVNSPTWHSNGINFTTSQYAFSLINNLDQDVTLVFVGAGNGGTAIVFGQIFGIQNNNGIIGNGEIRIQNFTGNSTQISLAHRNSAHTSDRSSGTITNPFNNSLGYTMLAGSAKINTILNIRNLNAGTSNSSTSAGLGIATLNRMQVNGRFNDGNPVQLGANITSSLCMIFSPQIDFATTSIYNLYKSTAGKGLGLT